MNKSNKTLLQNLVEELPKRGGWPKFDREMQVVQDDDGEVKFHFIGHTLEFERNNPGTWGSNTPEAWLEDFAPQSNFFADRSSDYTTAIITREQYESALAEKEHPLPWDDNCNDDDGWIDWAGGKPPVDNATVVDLKFRAGEIASGVEAGKYYWPHTGYEHDIVAYRICSEQAVDAEEPLTCTGVDGWIDWPGGECPIDSAAFVEYKMRNGQVDTEDAHLLRWDHLGFLGDIIAYRLHQPQEAEQTEADNEADLNDCIGQAPAPVWNGEGLPPVGAEIEWQEGTRRWYPGTVTAIGEQLIIIKEQNGEEGSHSLEYTYFRKANFERDELAAIIATLLDEHAGSVDAVKLTAAALIDAGYRKQ